LFINAFFERGFIDMGLIRAGAGALGGTMADQWKEFFYCDAIDKDTLVVKGAKRTSSRSSNTKAMTTSFQAARALPLPTASA